ncbi:MAG TPA: amino acid adenylation domain-containing protein [Longimicrobiales bacterium]|nr:amino acid adenylation domain-containing protein [Longimicrobiales bacterium]
MTGLQHQGFEASVDRHPAAVAIDDGGILTTYAELEGHANRLAALLRDLGCAPNARVCVLTGKNVHMYSAVLATLKAGGCWVPLSTAFPPERLRFLIELLEPAAVVLDPDTASLAALIRSVDAAVPIITLGTDPASDAATAGDRDLASFPASRAPCADLTPDDLCYIIFTSGSTGTPKGVMVRHRSSHEFLARCPDLFDIAAGSRFAHFSELTFDPSIFDVFHCWNSAGTLVPFNRRSHRINPGLFLEERQVNVLFTVPAVLAAIRDAGRLADPALHCVRHLLLTGEAVRPAHVREWYDAHPESTVYNMYGTTETAIISHCYRIPPDFPGNEPVPLGKPLAGLRVQLLDGDTAVSPGEAGESVVSGSQLAAGYWGNAYQTELSFGRDPVAPDVPVIRYRTGDLLREGADGLHYYVGRIDHQVKVRGHRVELEEVEQALLANFAVLEAGVVLSRWKDVDCLVAFAHTDGSTTPEELKAWLRARLPDFMVPFRILSTLGPLPGGRTGKLDRVALQRLAAEAMERES